MVELRFVGVESPKRMAERRSWSFDSSASKIGVDLAALPRPWIAAAATDSIFSQRCIGIGRRVSAVAFRRLGDRSPDMESCCRRLLNVR
jgi:hypothetical protein